MGIVKLSREANEMTFPKLARQKFDVLGGAKWLARVPRYSRILSGPAGRLPENEQGNLSAIYWTAYHHVDPQRSMSTGLLDSGLQGEIARYLGWPNRHTDLTVNDELRENQVVLASKILAAMAFEMSFPTTDALKTEASVLEQPRDQIQGKENIREFKRKVHDRLVEAGVYWLTSTKERDKPVWHQDVEAIESMNARGLEHFVLDGNDRALRFTDITVQAFFAALWASNYLDPSEFDQLWRVAPDSWQGRHSSFEEFWRFVADMPAKRTHLESWRKLFEPFYDSSLSAHLRSTDGTPIRSTELIYRTWDRMRDTSAGEVFRSEFGLILRGEQGERKKQEAQRLLAGLRFDKPLCEGKHGAGDNGEFVMGCTEEHSVEWDMDRGVRNNLEHRVKLTRFWMSVHCVRNVEYELFEPRRAIRRKFADEVSESELDDHPAVNVSWYDSLVFSLWLGELDVVKGERVRIVLPSEAQWEYCCRSGVEGTAFCWDGVLDDNRIEKGYCNFHWDRLWSSGKRPWSFTPKSGSPRHPISVDGRMRDGEVVGINRWGFSQLHGNVNEWCGDWYDRHYYAKSNKVDPLGPQIATERVSRGGSWFYGDVHCRAAYRNRFEPGARDMNNGFRLAAVPVSQAGNVW